MKHVHPVILSLVVLALALVPTPSAIWQGLCLVLGIYALVCAVRYDI